MNRALELAEALDKVVTHGLANTTMLSRVWASVLGVQEVSPQMTMALAAMQQKFELAKAEVSGLAVQDRAKDLYSKALVSLENSVHPSAVYGQPKKWLVDKQTQIDILFLAADFPSYLVPEVNEFTIQGLLEEIDELKQSIENGPFEGGFRTLILSNLDTIAMAVRGYSTLGPDGAASVFGAALAELLRLYRAPEMKEGPERNMMEKAIAIGKKVGTAVIFAGAVVSGAHALITDGSDLLGLGDSEEVQSEPNEEGSPALPPPPPPPAGESIA